MNSQFYFPVCFAARYVLEEINGNVSCGLPRGELKESYPNWKCCVLHTCFSSFFWPKTPAAIMKHKVKLNLEVKCMCGGEIGIQISDDTIEKLY